MVLEKYKTIKEVLFYIKEQFAVDLIYSVDDFKKTKTL